MERVKCVPTSFTLTDLHYYGWQLEWLCPYNLHIDWLALLWLAVRVIVQSSHWLGLLWLARLCPYNLHIDWLRLLWWLYNLHNVWLTLLWLAVRVTVSIHSPYWLVIVSIPSSHWLTYTAVVGRQSECIWIQVPKLYARIFSGLVSERLINPLPASILKLQLMQDVGVGSPFGH